MTIKQFFRYVPTKEQTEFVINLVKNDMSGARLYHDDERSDPNNIIFISGGGEDRGVKINPKEETIELFFPIHRALYDRNLTELEEEEMESLCAYIPLAHDAEMEELPLIIRYLSKKGVLTSR